MPADLLRPLANLLHPAVRFVAFSDACNIDIGEFQRLGSKAPPPVRRNLHPAVSTLSSNCKSSTRRTLGERFFSVTYFVSKVKGYSPILVLARHSLEPARRT
jgi:hypothetical protein